jgi:hypothetical protein
VNGSIHAIATEQSFVRRVHDGIDLQRGDVGKGDFDHGSGSRSARPGMIT